MFFQGPWGSLAWHWSLSKRAGCGWFTGWMNLKGMPNGFRPIKAPDEKPSFPERQTVFELATASARRYLWRSRCTGISWFQVVTQSGTRLWCRWAWGDIKSHPLLLWQTLCRSFLEWQTASPSLSRERQKCFAAPRHNRTRCLQTNGSTLITVFQQQPKC